MAKSDPAVDLLSNVKLFQGLTLKELRSVAARSKEMAFRAGETVTKEGTSGARFYGIVEGQASVDVLGRHRATLGPGQYFGEMALIDGEPRTATVTAVTDLRTLTIASFNFRPLLREQPGLAVKLLVELCRRLRELDRSEPV